MFAHPDDAELTCYGTLRRLIVENGATCHLVVATDGERGLPREILDRSRRDEARAAAALLPAEVCFLGLADCELDSVASLDGLISNVLSELEPDVVITHPRLSRGDSHPDHIALAHAVIGAARRSATATVLECEPLPFDATFEPNFFVDVSRYLGSKEEAIAKHGSQAAKQLLHADLASVRGRWWHYVSGRMLGEGRAVEPFRLVVHREPLAAVIAAEKVRRATVRS